MKKVFAIIAVLCILLGGGLILGGYAVNGFEPLAENFDKQVFAPTEYEAFDKVEVNSESLSLAIEKGDALSFTYYTNERVLADVAIENGVLKITEKIEGNWLRFNGWYGYRNRPVMKLVVPTEVSPILDLNGKAGNISFSGEYANVTIKTSAGNVAVKDAAVINLRIDAAAGNVTIDNLIADSVSANTKAGNVIVGKCGITGKLSVNCTTGNVKLNDVTAEEIVGATTLGNAVLTGVDARNMDFDLTTGNFEATFSESEREYTLNLSTNTGNIIPKTSIGQGERKLKVSTNTGNITVRFAG